MWRVSHRFARPTLDHFPAVIRVDRICVALAGAQPLLLPNPPGGGYLGVRGECLNKGRVSARVLSLKRAISYALCLPCFSLHKWTGNEARMETRSHPPTPTAVFTSFRAPWQQDRRLRARRLACERAAASALADLEGRRKTAEESVAARERSTANIRTKLRGQGEADQAKLQVSFLCNAGR